MRDDTGCAKYLALAFVACLIGCASAADDAGTRGTSNAGAGNAAAGSNNANGTAGQSSGQSGGQNSSGGEAQGNGGSTSLTAGSGGAGGASEDPGMGTGGDSDPGSTDPGGGGASTGGDGAGGDGAGGTDDSGGVPAEWTQCQMQEECVLTPMSCCGSCGAVTPDDAATVNAQYLDAFRSQACDGPGLCPACFMENDPRVGALCDNGHCIVELALD